MEQFAEKQSQVIRNHIKLNEAMRNQELCTREAQRSAQIGKIIYESSNQNLYSSIGRLFVLKPKEKVLEELEGKIKRNREEAASWGTRVQSMKREIN